jgi:hypothetical protein
MCWNHYRDDWGRRWERETTRTAPPDTMRVSDADRQQVIDRLSRHTADGRLTLDEFEARVDEVVRARTRSELDATLRELPAEPVPYAEPGRRGRPFPVPLAIVVIVLAIALIPEGMAWVLIPVGFWLFSGCRGRRYVGRRQDQLTSV